MPLQQIIALQMYLRISPYISLHIKNMFMSIFIKQIKNMYKNNIFIAHLTGTDKNGLINHFPLRRTVTIFTMHFFLLLL